MSFAGLRGYNSLVRSPWAGAPWAHPSAGSLYCVKFDWMLYGLLPGWLDLAKPQPGAHTASNLTLYRLPAGRMESIQRQNAVWAPGQVHTLWPGAHTPSSLTLYGLQARFNRPAGSPNLTLYGLLALAQPIPSSWPGARTISDLTP